MGKRSITKYRLLQNVANISIGIDIRKVWVGEWLLLNAKWAIFQLYHGKNKLYFDVIELIWFYATVFQHHIMLGIYLYHHQQDASTASSGLLEHAGISLIVKHNGYDMSKSSYQSNFWFLKWIFKICLETYYTFFS
jgi:hypothetical protein